MIFGRKAKIRTALDWPARKLNEFERGLVENVRQHGWHQNHVFGDADGPGFTYTVGFWRTFNFPEVIVFSLPSELASDILWDLCRALRAKRPPSIGLRTDELFGNSDGVLIPVAKRHYGEYPLSDRWFYGGDDFPCVQLIWPDKSNRMPWEEGFDQSFADDQPDLSGFGWAEAIQPRLPS